MIFGASSQKQLSLRVKLVSLMFLISASCVSSLAVISYIKSSTALHNVSVEQQVSLGEIMKVQISSYLEQMKINTIELSQSRLMEGLFLAYEGAFYGAALDEGQDVIVKNQFYDNLQKLYSERVLKLVSNYKVDNILLVTVRQQIVMSALDDAEGKFLGRSLSTGSFAKGKLANCVKNALDSKKSGEVFYSGYFYSEASKKAHGFLCAKQIAEFDHLSEGIKAGDDMGVVVTELSQKTVNEITSSRFGMGKTGQAYFVAEDHTLRSDMFLNKEKFNVNQSVGSDEKISTPSIDEALKGNSGVVSITSPMGVKALSYYTPVEFFSQKWAVIVEKDEDEIYAPLHEMIKFEVLVSILVEIIVMIIALFLTRAIVNPVISANKTLDDISKDVNNNSQNAKNSAQILARGANELTSSLQEIVTTLDEVTSMVNKNVENVNKSSQKADQCQDVADKGKKSVERMISAMDDIKSTNADISVIMEEISRRMEEISNVINEIANKTNVINDIVFQTKLLSFNASVEAARAGEHGKGFAVVAEEVGNLATASGNAAKEISKMLADSLKKVDDMVKDTNSKIDKITTVGREKVEIGTTTATQCGNALTEISNVVAEVNSKISEISRASTEQAQGITEVSRAINSLDQVASSTSDIANDMRGSSNSLQEYANNLNSVVIDLIYLVHGKKETTKNDSNHPSDEGGDKTNSKKTKNEAIDFKNEKNLASKRDESSKEIENKRLLEDETPSASDPSFENVV